MHVWDSNSPFMCVVVTNCAVSIFELSSDIFFSLELIVVAGRMTLLSSFSLHAPTSSDIFLTPIRVISSIFSSTLHSISEAPILAALLLSGPIPLSSLFNELLFIASVTCCFLLLLVYTCLIGGFDIPSRQCEEKNDLRKQK